MRRTVWFFIYVSFVRSARRVLSDEVKNRQDQNGQYLPEIVTREVGGETEAGDVLAGERVV